MKKYIIIALCIISPLRAMKPENNALIVECEWDNKFYDHDYFPVEAAHHYLAQKYAFNNETVLSLGKNKYIHNHIASTARRVDSNREKSTCYDTITSFALPKNKDELKKNLSELHGCLRPNGPFIGITNTQTDGKNSIELSLFTTIYSKIYEAASVEKQKSLPIIPKQTKENPLSVLPTDDEVKKDISNAGYDIVYYALRKFNIIIKNTEIFKKMVKANVIKTFSLSAQEENLAEECTNLFMAQLKEDKEKNLIYPYSVTEIFLSKMEKHDS